MRALRRGLLLFLGLFVVGVIGLYWFGRDRSSPQEGGSTAASRSRDDSLVSGSGFERTVSIGDTRLFSISAQRYRSTKEGLYQFEEIRIDWDREDGSSYVLEAEEGTFDENDTEATVFGNVLFRSSSGLELRSTALSLVQRGRQVVSTAPVAFSLDERYSGRADQLRLRVRKSLLYLTGNVVIEGTESGGQDAEESAGAETDAEPGFRLECGSLSYSEEEKRLLADGGVVLTQGPSVMASRRLSLVLDKEDRSVLFVLARWGVEGTFVRAAEDGRNPQLIQFSSSHMSTEFDDETEDPKRIELEGDATVPAVFEVEELGLPTRRLRSNLLHLELADGQLQRARSLAPVEVVEYEDPDDPLRVTSANSADAIFDSQGELQRLDLDGEVRYRDREVKAFGDAAELMPSAGVTLLTGSPARLESARGVIESPTIRRQDAAGEVRASEPVRATLQAASDGGLAGSALGNSKAPVQVQSKTAVWRDAENAFEFSGSVRAWQEENLLIAETVKGRTDDESLNAAGAVKTIWVPTPKPGDDDARGPLEVTAERLFYQKAQGLLTYDGSARMHQNGKLVFCDRVEVFLADSEEVESARCLGSVSIRDPETSRAVKGETADYRLDSGTIEVIGDPVTLTEANGTQVTGPRLMYYVADGRAQIVGERVELDPEEEPEDDDADDSSTVSEEQGRSR